MAWAVKHWTYSEHRVKRTVALEGTSPSATRNPLELWGAFVVQWALFSCCLNCLYLIIHLLHHVCIFNSCPWRLFLIYCVICLYLVICCTIRLYLCSCLYNKFAFIYSLNNAFVFIFFYHTTGSYRFVYCTVGLCLLICCTTSLYLLIYCTTSLYLLIYRTVELYVCFTIGLLSKMHIAIKLCTRGLFSSCPWFFCFIIYRKISLYLFIHPSIYYIYIILYNRSACVYFFYEMFVNCLLSKVNYSYPECGKYKTITFINVIVQYDWLMILRIMRQTVLNC